MPQASVESICRANASMSADKTLTLEFEHTDGAPSLRRNCCRSVILKALSANPTSERLIIIHGSRVVYDRNATHTLAELAEIISSLNPNVCVECSKKLGDVWADPLSYYYLARSRHCNRCSAELERIGQELKKSEFVKEAIRASKPELSWNIQAKSIPSFFAAEVLETRGKGVEHYTVGDVEIVIGKHRTRPDMLMFLDYPELHLSENELEALTKAYDLVSSRKVKAGAIIADEFDSACASAIDVISAGMNVDKAKLLTILLRHTSGLGVIEPLLKDERLQDVYIDSRSSLVHVVHSQWGECVTNIRMTSTELDKLATRLRSLSGRPLDASSPVLHTEIESMGIRVAGICPPSTYKGIGFAFRRRKQSPWTLPEFIQAGMLDAKVAGLLSFLVDGQSTMLVTGPRASGKTSLMTALLLEIPQNTRMIVIEDTPEVPVDELQKDGYKIEHLKTEAWAKGFELSAEDALRTSLRLGESTLILGEVRGTEAKALFEAMRVGAAGNVVMGTVHGSSAYDTWDRVVNDLKVPSSSFKAVDVIVSAGTIRFGDKVQRHRRLMAVTEVRKDWKNEPAPKDFVDIASFSRRGQTWKTALSKSHAVRKIAEMKGISVAEAVRNISYRAKMKSDLVKLAKNKPRAVTAPFVIAANNAYLRAAAESKNSKQTYKKWSAWLKTAL